MMRVFTKAAAAFTIAAVLFTGAGLAFTQEPEPVWRHGTDAWIFGLTWDKNPGEQNALKTQGQWLHYTSDQQAWGVSLSLLKDGPAESGSIGPAWEWNFPPLKHGHFFALIRAEILAGDAADLASAVGILGVGYKLHVGDSSAVRWTLDYSEGLNVDGGAPAELLEPVDSRYTLGIAIELGVNKDTPVR